jgi:hypothetical protein
MSTMTKHRCRSDNPAQCRYHGTPVPSATSISSFFGKNLPKNLQSKKVSTNETPVSITNRAETVALGYTGEQPKWWKKFAEESEAHPTIPSRPELLDVIDSPVGKLAVVWQPDDQEDRNIIYSGLGIKACYFKSFKTGEDLGHVKIQYKTDETFARSFKNDDYTLFRWKEESFPRREYGLEDAPETTELEDKKALNKTIWKNIVHNSRTDIITSNKERVYCSDVTEEHAPDDQTVKKIIAKERKKLEQEMADNLGNYSTGGFVERSRVDEKLSGKGYGTALYLYTARKLAEQNTVIRASGIQSQDAQNLWNRFSKKYPNRVKPVTFTYMGKEKTVPTLDFR